MLHPDYLNTIYKKYGSLIKYENNNELINCRILEKYCNLEKEWNLVIKPYMEE